MEEDIDLRPYARALLQHWWWVVGLGLLAVVVGFIGSSLVPALYDASSVVVVAQPRYQLQFDSRFTTPRQATLPYKAFPTLATSDAVLQAVLDAYGSLPAAAIKTLDFATLSSMAKVTTGDDPSLLLLHVRAASPQVSVAVANLWADCLVKRGNDLYGDSAQDVIFLQGQVAQSRQVLDDANKALVELQGHNRLAVLDAQLTVQKQTQRSYLSTQAGLTDVIHDIQGLRAQMAKQPAGQAVSPADSLTLLLLQIRAFNTSNDLPIQLQVNSGDTLASMSRQDQIAFLEDLVTTLQGKSSESAVQLAEMEPKMLALQRQLQEAQTESDNLKRRQKLAEDTYLTVSRKLDEASIAAQTDNRTFELGSYADMPDGPAGPGRVRYGLVAGMVGLMLGVIVVSGSERWKR